MSILKIAIVFGLASTLVACGGGSSSSSKSSTATSSSSLAISSITNSSDNSTTSSSTPPISSSDSSESNLSSSISSSSMQPESSASSTSESSTTTSPQSSSSSSTQSSSSSSTQSSASTAAVAIFSFENDLIDTVTQNRQGTTTAADISTSGGAAIFTNGVEGKAIHLDGTYGIRLPDNLINSHRYAVSMWVKPNVLTQYTPAFFGMSSDVSWINFAPSSWNSKTLVWSGSNTYYDGDTGQTIPANTWTHLAFSVDEGNIEIYVNGEVAFSGTDFPDVFNGVTNMFALGVTYWPWDIPFNGLIDEVFIYDQPLDQDELDRFEIPQVKAIEDLEIGDTTAVIGNLTLPTSDSYGAIISWQSSAPSVVSDLGVITRPAQGEPNAEVMLTATLQLAGVTRTKQFNVVVLAPPSNSAPVPTSSSLASSSTPSFNSSLPVSSASSSSAPLSSSSLAASSRPPSSSSTTSTSVSSSSNPAPSSSSSSSTDQVASFEFENNLRDSIVTSRQGSTTANDLLTSGGTATYGAGIIGTALQMDGTYGVRLPDNLIQSYSYTVSMWIKPTVVTPYTPAFFAGTSDYNWINFTPSSPNSMASVWSVSPAYDANTSHTVTPNTWIHLAFAVDHGNIDVYINGATTFSGGSFPDVLNGATTLFALGVTYWPWDTPFNGLIDEVHIYDRPLSDLEISQLEVTPANAVNSLDLGDLTSVTSDIALPTSDTFGSSITWQSSDLAIVSNSGVVTRPVVGEANSNVILTATLTVGGVTKTKTFTATVIANN